MWNLFKTHFMTLLGLTAAKLRTQRARAYLNLNSTVNGLFEFIRYDFFSLNLNFRIVCSDYSVERDSAAF